MNRRRGWLRGWGMKYELGYEFRGGWEGGVFGCLDRNDKYVGGERL